jgi:hypothetical protein
MLPSGIANVAIWPAARLSLFLEVKGVKGVKGVKDNILFIVTLKGISGKMH